MLGKRSAEEEKEKDKRLKVKDTNIPGSTVSQGESALHSQQYYKRCRAIVANARQYKYQSYQERNQFITINQCTLVVEPLHLDDPSLPGSVEPIREILQQINSPLSWPNHFKKENQKNYQNIIEKKNELWIEKKTSLSRKYPEWEFYYLNQKRINSKNVIECYLNGCLFYESEIDLNPKRQIILLYEDKIPHEPSKYYQLKPYDWKKTRKKRSRKKAVKKDLSPPKPGTQPIPYVMIKKEGKKVKRAPWFKSSSTLTDEEKYVICDLAMKKAM